MSCDNDLYEKTTPPVFVL